MQKLNNLWSPVFILATGFVLGLGAANYFAADNAGNDIASTSTITPQETAVASEAAEPAETAALSTVLDAPKKPADKIDTQTQDTVANNTLSVDISLTETVDTSRLETPVTEPSPEELVYNPPQTYVTTSPLNSQETDELEITLRQASEQAARLSHQGDAGLLQHEML